MNREAENREAEKILAILAVKMIQEGYKTQEEIIKILQSDNDPSGNNIFLKYEREKNKLIYDAHKYYKPVNEFAFEAYMFLVLKNLNNLSKGTEIKKDDPYNTAFKIFIYDDDNQIIINYINTNYRNDRNKCQTRKDANTITYSNWFREYIDFFLNPIVHYIRNTTRPLGFEMFKIFEDNDVKIETLNAPKIKKGLGAECISDEESEELQREYNEIGKALYEEYLRQKSALAAAEDEAGGARRRRRKTTKRRSKATKRRSKATKKRKGRT
jgi:hypothetical protein